MWKKMRPGINSPIEADEIAEGGAYKSAANCFSARNYPKNKELFNTQHEYLPACRCCNVNCFVLRKASQNSRSCIYAFVRSEW